MKYIYISGNYIITQKGLGELIEFLVNNTFKNKITYE